MRSLTLFIALLIACATFCVLFLRSGSQGDFFSSSARIERKLAAFFLIERAVVATSLGSLSSDKEDLEHLRDLALQWRDHGCSLDEAVGLFVQLPKAVQDRFCAATDLKCRDGGSGTFMNKIMMREMLELKAKHSAEPVYCETGFNFGRSAMIALLAGYSVYAFDVQVHSYSDAAVELL